MLDKKKVTDTAGRLREYMNLTNTKQADLVRITGLSKSVISLYVSGKREPMQDNIYTLAHSLNVSPAWLMGLDVPMKEVKMDTDFVVQLPDDKLLFIETITKDKQLKRLCDYYMKLSEGKRELLTSVAESMVNK